jgi:hypothetical protein
MVSKKPDAICFHCGEILEKCDIEYNAYINMTEEDRNKYRENYKSRIKLYHEKLDNMLQKKFI